MSEGRQQIAGSADRPLAQGAAAPYPLIVTASGDIIQISGQVVMISGQHVYLESGATIIVQISGLVVEISGEVVQISGQHIYQESGAIVLISGQTVELESGTGPISVDQLSGAVVLISGQTVSLASGSIVTISGNSIYQESGAVVLISGQTITQASGAVVLISGQTITQASGAIVLISGQHLYQESGAVVLISGQTVISKVSGEIVGIVTPTTGGHFQQAIPNASTQLSALAAKTVTIKHMTAISSGNAVYIGVSVAAAATSFELLEGEAINIDIDNANKLYAIATESGDRICVIGVT